MAIHAGRWFSWVYITKRQMTSMFSNTFIFTVDNKTYETHRKYGFCATGSSNSPIESIEKVTSGDIPAIHYGLISNILNVKEGAIIFFYVTGEGFKGIYEAKHSPFFDATEIEGVPASRPFRCHIRCLYNFDNAVPENALFSTTERLRVFWFWYHNKIRRTGRGCTPLDPDAKNALIELLIRFNNGQESTRNYVQKEYPNAHKIKELKNLKVSYKKTKQEIDSEAALEALMMNSFREEAANTATIFGNFSNMEWFADQIPYHISGKTIDMMLYHRSKAYLDVDTRYQYTVIELKKGKAEMKCLHQLLEYCEWAGNQMAGGDTHLIQPALVANSFDERVLDYLFNEKENRSPFKSLKLVEYSYTHEQGLCLNQINNIEGLDGKRYEQIRKKYLSKSQAKQPLQDKKNTALN